MASGVRRFVGVMGALPGAHPLFRKGAAFGGSREGAVMY